MSNVKFVWNKEGLRTILAMWPNHTCQEIADKIGCSKQALAMTSAILRKNGANLPRKVGAEAVASLAREVIAEAAASV